MTDVATHLMYNEIHYFRTRVAMGTIRGAGVRCSLELCSAQPAWSSIAMLLTKTLGGLLAWAL